MPQSQIPIIDIAPFLDGSDAGRKAVAAEVDRACRTIGFFLIKGHGVPQDLIDRTYGMADAFFRMPVADKLAIRLPSPEIPRGYTPFRGETLSAGLGQAAPADLKEMVDMGPVDVPPDAYFTRPEAGSFYHPNLWPAKPPRFREVMEVYYRRMNRLANDLMGIFAHALGQPDDFYFDKLDKNISALRLICYPEQHEPPEPGQLRSGAHTDYGTLTILMSDRAAGGLQAQHRDGTWIDVVPEPGCYVVNIGDVMPIVTQDRWVSTLHRVVNPPLEQADSARRHSVVFFHQPNYDALIETLPSCLPPNGRATYQPLTYKEHWTRKWMATRM